MCSKLTKLSHIELSSIAEAVLGRNPMAGWFFPLLFFEPQGLPLPLLTTGTGSGKVSEVSIKDNCEGTDSSTFKRLLLFLRSSPAIESDVSCWDTDTGSSVLESETLSHA